ncbi:MAG: DUF2723 domain-containing protein [Salinivirgaceae bacterium]|nr:DUF2723 domain-containing protein [Salinivirgaceae bacterium]
MNYRKINLIGGWLAFAISAYVYLSTIPHTTSFWDCGEFIGSAFRLEVCHPPGSPLFLLIARIFTMFAPSSADVATTVNAMSALASAFTIMFLFWTVTHLAKKMVDPDNTGEMGKTMAIMGAGIVGALAYTFSDTFWYSAVEGEVYAFSSLFTAVVFWAILKWENVANEPSSNKWLILIAYLMGLSIGVHLLNLLAIPAIVLVYYFKKHTPTTKGVIGALTISVVILGAIMYGIIPYTVKIASWFELLFVNGMGMPFKSGVAIFAILLISGLTYGIYYTYKNNKVVLNTILLGVTVIIMGYSSYAMVVIRSNANPPMDQNNPEQMFSLLSYLNREQYGDRPLLYGQVYSAPGLSSTDKISYRQKDGKYVPFNNGIEIQYDKRFYTLFPRMFSASNDHVESYKQWANIKGRPITLDYGQEPETRIKPTFGENLKFLVSYQVGFMYFRYFMWNFVGRQNDVQSHGEISSGNWISGISFIDNARIGDQTLLPESMQNKGNNKYYFLPLILGIVGMVYQYFRHNKDFWVVLLLFVLTGIAIVIYLNQTPLQPRERDYAFAGSFYAFAIWIGIGVLALYEGLRKVINSKVSAITATTACLLAAPVLMGAENWDDHDRSNRFMARDFAYNYLNSCDKDALIFTNGDNDTFPLWYIQEVEGVRTDVRVMCLPYLSTDWYINQMRRQVWNSPPVKFTIDPEKYVMGTRDMTYVLERKEMFLNEKYEASKKELEPIYARYYGVLLSFLEKSDFPKIETTTWEQLKVQTNKVSPTQVIGLARMLTQKDAVVKYKLNESTATIIENETNRIFDKIGEAPLPLKLAVRFITDDSRQSKLQNGENYLPARRFIIPVDKQKAIESGTVHPKDTANIVDNIIFTINERMIGKADLAMLDLFANNDWERPIYFTSVGSGTFASLKSYCQNEGFAYRLVPVKLPGQSEPRINTEVLYDNLMNKFLYRGINDMDVYLDWTNMRTLRVVSLRDKFIALADELVKENKREKAAEVLKRGFIEVPLERVSIDYFSRNVFKTYYATGNIQAADSITRLAALCAVDEINFVMQRDPLIANGYQREEQMAYLVLQELMEVLENNSRTKLRTEISTALKEKLIVKTPLISEIEQLNREQKDILKMLFAIDQKHLNTWIQTLPSEHRKMVDNYLYLDEFESKAVNIYALWAL